MIGLILPVTRMGNLIIVMLLLILESLQTVAETIRVQNNPHGATILMAPWHLLMRQLLLLASNRYT